MDKFIINGGRQLAGEIKIHGSKNAVLPILAATIINRGESVIHNVPDIKDVEILIEMLEGIGCKCRREGGTLSVKAQSITNNSIPQEMVSKMRSSIVLLGAMMNRCKEVKISQPGGCAIGSRPIDMHLDGLRLLGAKINESDKQICCEFTKLIGNRIKLRFPSVGATQNIMFAAVAAEGETIIENAAKEPEIVDLEHFLNKIGAKVRGAGTDTITIEGVKECNTTVEHTIIPDRIVAGTLMTAAAMTKGNILMHDAIADHMRPIIEKLTKCGCIIHEYDDKLHIYIDKKLKGAGIIKTLPYPGFPTDMQAQFMAAMTVASGISVFAESIFENRYMHVEELVKMGADITLDGEIALVKGVKRIFGVEVSATDLRAGAALVLAGLAAEGTTIVNKVESYVDRGYVKLEEQLQSLGADIQRIRG